MRKRFNFQQKQNTEIFTNLTLASLLFLFPLISNRTNYIYIKEILVFSTCAILILPHLLSKNKIHIQIYDIYIIIGIVYITSHINNWEKDTYTIISYLILFYSISKTKWNINILRLIISISTIHAVMSIVNNYTMPLIGIMGNSGITGIYLAITYPIGFYLLLNSNTIHKIIFGILLLPIILTIFLTDSRNGILSVLTCSILIYCNNSNSFIEYIKKINLKQSIIFAPIIILLSIFSLYNLINHRKDSVDGRILIYKITTNMIFNRPISGFGYNTFYSIYPEYQMTYFKKNPDSKYIKFADNTKYGFNEILQIGAEYGIIGIILTFVFTIYLFTIKNEKNKFIVSPVKYTILSIFLLSLFSYPLRRVETLLTITTFTGILASFDKRFLLSFNRTHHKLIIISLAICYFEIINTTINRNYAYTIWQESKKTSIPDKEKLLIYNSIEDKLKYDTLFLYDYAVILSNCNKNEESNIYFEKVLKHMNTSFIWILKGNNYKNTNNFNNAQNCYIHAFKMVPNRIFPLYQLMLLYKEYNKKNEMIKTAKLIKDFKIKIPSYTTLKIKEEANEIISIYNK